MGQTGSGGGSIANRFMSYRRVADCRFCGSPFLSISPTHRCCSTKCIQADEQRAREAAKAERKAAIAKRSARVAEARHLPPVRPAKRKLKKAAGSVCPSTVGAANELLVAGDLMRRGVHVFRALSPSCICDLVAIHGGKVFRVEVTTGLISCSGTLSWNRRDHSRFDVLALVVAGTEIRYVPDVFCDKSGETISGM